MKQSQPVIYTIYTPDILEKFKDKLEIRQQECSLQFDSKFKFYNK